jgi:hypothetical protein
MAAGVTPTIPPFNEGCGKSVREIYDLLTPYSTYRYTEHQDGGILVQLGGRWLREKVDWSDIRAKSYTFDFEPDPDHHVPDDDDYDMYNLRVLHPVGAGSPMLFRPTLWEVMCLVSCKVDDLCDVEKIWCSTDTVSDDLSECYRDNAHEAITTLLVKYSEPFQKNDGIKP